MSKAVVFTEYGPPEVLHVIDVAVPEPGPGEVRVRVEAAGVQPFDCMFRSGGARQRFPATFPQRIGNELAGVVDAVGPGVAGLSIGSEVLGWATLASAAEHVVVRAGELVEKPASMPWSEAGALSASGQTASTAIERLAVRAGETVLIHAAAGGVGSFAVQIAKAMGATVIGTASDRNHDYLRSLGTTPVLYGEGLVDRVRAAAPRGVDAALIAVGSEEAFVTSRELVADAARVGTIAFHPLAERLGVARLTSDRSATRLASLIDLYVLGKLRITIQETYPFARAADAHRAMESGHVRGKIVLVP